MSINNTEQKTIEKEIGKYFELNKNENSTYQNMWDIVKGMFKEKFININAYFISI